MSLEVFNLTSVSESIGNHFSQEQCLNKIGDRYSGASSTQRFSSVAISINPSQVLKITHLDFSVNQPLVPLFLKYCLSQLDESCIDVDIRLCRSLHEFQSMLFCHLEMPIMRKVLLMIVKASL